MLKPGANVVEWPDDDRHYELSAGAILADRVLATEVPQGLVTFNDAYAFGATTSLRRAGIEPGRDVALASFDDIAMVSEFAVPLTTVRTFPDRMGREALRLLRRRLAHPHAPPRRTVITPELVVRESTQNWRQNRGGDDRK